MKGKLFAVLIFCFIGVIFIYGCKEQESAKKENIKATQEEEKVEAEVEKEAVSEEPASEEKAPVSTENPVVVFETSMGNFDLELYPDKAPITVENFLNYVNEGFFDGLIFHRIISSFVIQGGGFDAQMNKKQTKPPIKNEASNGLKNLKYTISMARTNDPNSATSQFFLNVRDNSNLDYRPGNPGYAVFGKIISGFDVIEKIRVVPTTTKGMYQDVPVEPVTMNKVYLKK